MLGLGHCLSSHITVPGKARSKHHGHKGSSFKCFHQCSPRQTLSLTKWKFKWIFVLFFSRHVTVFQDLKPKFSKFKSRLWELQQKPNYATERETGRERSIQIVHLSKDKCKPFISEQRSHCFDAQTSIIGIQLFYILQILFLYTVFVYT